MRLLAKWRDWDEGSKAMAPTRGFFLVDHISECLCMAKYLLYGSIFGVRLYAIMDLSRFLDIKTFKKLCLLAVFLHDLGKAAHEFQEMLWRKERAFQAGLAQPLDRYIQKYRHEAMSLYLLQRIPALHDWLLQEAGSEQNALLVLAAVFGHHRKALKPGMPEDNWDNAQKGKVYLQALTQRLAALAQEYRFDTAFPICADVEVSPKDVADSQAAFEDRYGKATEAPLSAAVKWVTIIADVLGSMTPQDAGQIDGYGACLQEYLTQSVFACQATDYTQHIADWATRTPWPFQEQARVTLGDGLIVISCGGGKSAAGYLWGAIEAGLKLIFTTPTTATATQIHLDNWHREAALRHSRERLDRLHQPKFVVGDLKDDLEDGAAIIRDFAAWDKAVTHTTVDQVLGVLSFNHRAVMWLLCLINAQVIFDEVHCYDRLMAKWHQQFLEWFPGVRVLNMSATVTDETQQRIQVARPQVTIITDHAAGSLARQPRYRIHILNDRAEADALFGPGALWFVNQVRLAQDIGLQFADAAVLHSRFNYPDRVRLQAAVMQGFRAMREHHAPGLRVVSTQVAEMSMDISAWLLLSEIADLATMIQRLGRLNRYLEVLGGIGHAYFYLPETGYPYDPRGDTVNFETLYLPWLAQLTGRDISQWDLEQAFKAFKWAKVSAPPFTAPRLVETYPRKLRIQQTATLGILERDLPADRRTWPKVPMLELQEKEIPLYLKPKEREALETRGNWLRYRYVLPRSLYSYDSRLGLQKGGPCFNDLDGQGGD